MSSTLVYIPSVSLFLFFSFIYFFIGFIGLIKSSKNVILLIICIEIFFLSSHLLLVSSSIILDDLVGIVFSMFSLVVAGGETALGLALIIIYYRYSRNFNLLKFTKLKG